MPQTPGRFERVFYRPADGVAADFIPFYWNGEYHLFYLKDYRDAAGRGEGTPWFHLATKDFVRFEDLGEALPRGPLGAQDVWVFTGSVCEKDGTFHIFYTGHNQHFPKVGRPCQVVLHAESRDLKTWSKDPSFSFGATEGYERDDWRDPFVYRDPRLGQFGMLLAARRKEGPERHRGCVAFATSPDLKAWTVREPFWAPDLFFTHECPDLFQLGEWWYLVWSEFSEQCVTQYRMSRSLDGPWLAPANPTFDGRAYYAAKTASDGKRRFLFGWLPTRAEEKDEGHWQWGGDLVVHEIVQQPGGELTVRAPETVLAAFTRPVPLVPARQLGAWELLGRTVRGGSPGRYSACVLAEMPDVCLVETEVTLEAGTRAAGLLLRASDDLNSHYQLRIEPARRRLVLDRAPRPGDQPFMLERPLETRPGVPVKLRVLVDGTCLVAYADDRVALSCRLYNSRRGQVGLFVTEGQAVFASLAARAP